jgi:hypothetical protein
MAKRHKHIKHEPESYEEMRKKFPEALVKAFVKVCSNWENENLYEEYIKQRDEYLGKSADRLEQGKLIVFLTRATMDIRDAKEKTQKTQE